MMKEQKDNLMGMWVGFWFGVGTLAIFLYLFGVI